MHPWERPEWLGRARTKGLEGEPWEVQTTVLEEVSLSIKTSAESITPVLSTWMAEQLVVAMKWGNSHGAKGLYLNYIFNKTRRTAWTRKDPLRSGCQRALSLKTACRSKSRYCDGNWAIKPNRNRNFGFMHCMIESTEWMY